MDTEISKPNNNTISFGLSSEELFIAFIEAYINNSNRRYLTALRLEKLLVIFLKIGIAHDFFDVIRSEKSDTILSVKYYLHGSIVTTAKQKAKNDQYFLSKGLSYFSQKLVHDNLLIKDESQYFINKPKIFISHDNAHLESARSIGKLFSFVLEKEKYINDRDLVILTSCFSTNDIVGSLFAELKLFKASYSDYNKKSSTKKTLTIRNQQFFTAINSGLFKFRNFLKKEPSKIIQKVSANLDKESRQTWISLWPEADLDFNLIDDRTFSVILEYGILLYKCDVLINCLDNYWNHGKADTMALSQITESFVALIASTVPLKHQLIVEQDLFRFHNLFVSSIGFEQITEELTKILDIFDDVSVKLGPRKPFNKKEKKRSLRQPDTINVLLASPGDTQIERAFLLDKLERKFRTDGHESHCQRRLIVHAWEDIATQSGYGQDIINYKYLKNVDIVLAVFKHKLGTPTLAANGSVRAESGTAEELLYAINNNNSSKYPLGMAYFYERPPNVQLDSPNFKNIVEDWEKLKVFKESIKSKILYKSYDGKLDLLNKACVDIAQNVKEIF